MEDFFDRLDKYMNFKGLNDNQMTVLAGLSIGSLGKQRSGGRGLSNKSIAKLLHAFKDLNAEWLIIGEGEMLRHIDKDGLPQVCTQTSGDPPECARCKDKDAVIAAQRAQIESQTELLDLLKQARPSTNDGQKRKTA